MIDTRGSHARRHTLPAAIKHRSRRANPGQLRRARAAGTSHLEAASQAYPLSGISDLPEDPVVALRQNFMSSLQWSREDGRGQAWSGCIVQPLPYSMESSPAASARCTKASTSTSLMATASGWAQAYRRCQTVSKALSPRWSAGSMSSPLVRAERAAACKIPPSNPASTTHFGSRDCAADRLVRKPAVILSHVEVCGRPTEVVLQLAAIRCRQLVHHRRKAQPCEDKLRSVRQRNGSRNFQPTRHSFSMAPANGPRKILQLVGKSRQRKLSNNAPIVVS